MPSPVGHAVGAIAAGWLIGGLATPRRALLTQAAIFAALGIAPDLDLLAGRHRAETHSIGAALAAGAIAAWWRWPLGATRARIFWAACCAWVTHPLLDTMGDDSSLPYGLMAFWPLSRDYVVSGVSLFFPISRRWYLDGFIARTATAVAWEAVILLPIFLLVYWLRRSGGPAATVAARRGVSGRGSSSGPARRSPPAPSPGERHPDPGADARAQ